jgi:membrane associated rhomboid family serine protease
MASGPDLFVVCKSCGSEVSPYITECPYCGTRLRKRAPKLDRGGVPKPPRQARRPTLGRLRPGEIPGIRADRRPYGTIVLILASLLATLAWRTGIIGLEDAVLAQGVHDERWRTVTTLFVYGSTGYEILTLGVIALFGWLLERRHGLWAPVLVFLAGGVGGMFVAIAGGDASVAMGGNAGALALLGAWAMRDVLARHRGAVDDSDLLGALVIAVVMVVIPVVAPEASPLAGLGGGIIGCILGLGLARLPER